MSASSITVHLATDLLLVIPFVSRLCCGVWTSFIVVLPPQVFGSFFLEPNAVEIVSELDQDHPKNNQIAQQYKPPMIFETPISKLGNSGRDL